MSCLQSSPPSPIKMETIATIHTCGCVCARTWDRCKDARMDARTSGCTDAQMHRRMDILAGAQTAAQMGGRIDRGRRRECTDTRNGHGRMGAWTCERRHGYMYTRTCTTTTATSARMHMLILSCSAIQAYILVSVSGVQVFLCTGCCFCGMGWLPFVAVIWVFMKYGLKALRLLLLVLLLPLSLPLHLLALVIKAVGGPNLSVWTSTLLRPTPTSQAPVPSAEPHEHQD